MCTRRFTDEVGRTLWVPNPPRRVISLVPSLTETLFDLGLGERIVGVTNWCGPALPPGVERPRVGGVCNPRLDRMRELEPDLVLVGRDENSLRDVEILEAGGVPVFAVHPQDVGDAATTVVNLGRLLGIEEAAGVVAEDIERERARVLDRTGPLEPTPTVFPIWKGPWTTVGPGSYPAAILEDAGARLVGLESFAPYPRLSLERAANARPALVLLPDEPYDFHADAGREFVCALGRLSGSLPRAVKVDGRWPAWYGSRSGERLAKLARIIHPAG